MQDRSNSSELAMELLQSYTEPLIYQSNTFASDRCLIDVNPRVFAIWDVRISWDVQCIVVDDITLPMVALYVLGTGVPQGHILATVLVTGLS